MSGLIGKLPRTVTYGRIERITIHLTEEGVRRLLEEAGEIPKGFKVEFCDFDPGDIILVREQPETQTPQLK